MLHTYILAGGSDDLLDGVIVHFLPRLWSMVSPDAVGDDVLDGVILLILPHLIIFLVVNVVVDKAVVVLVADAFEVDAIVCLVSAPVYDAFAAGIINVDDYFATH
ncbi:unnamed protein product [Protopolystoma xenopodis]|uniref:Uncharacterized protein n=1 Tax=Protopolystoma xenopodis TaxID=117903 RepID=A0A3S5CDM2_9PLAT|nr:unnamed protein product [Protopolystoma xenopodis]